MVDQINNLGLHAVYSGILLNIWFLCKISLAFAADVMGLLNSVVSVVVHFVEDEFRDICTSTQEDLGSTGFLASPGYPALYSLNIDCSLLLAPPPGMIIDVQLQVMDLELQSGCSDELKICRLLHHQRW